MANQSNGKKSDVKNGKSNGHKVKVYTVDDSSKKEKVLQTFLLILIVVLAVAAIFSAIHTFFPNLFGKFSLGGELAAVVNGKTITMTQLNEEYSRLPMQYQSLITKEAFLDQLINEILIKDEATRQGLTVSEQEVDKSINDFKQQNNITDEKLAELLASKKLDMTGFRALVKSQLLVDAFEQKNVKSKVNVTTEQALQYYNENPDTFKMPEQVTARHILITATEENDQAANDQVNQILKEIKQDKSNFCELVTKYSSDPGSIDNCGEYTFQKGQMVAEFENTAFSQNIGAISIVKTRFGYHIIWTVNKTTSQIVNFKDVQDQIITMLEGQQEKMIYSEILADLKDKATITNYYTKALEEQAKKEAEVEAKAKAEQEKAAQETTNVIVEEPTVEEEQAVEEKPAEETPVETETVTDEKPATVIETATIETTGTETTIGTTVVIKESLVDCLSSKGAKLYGAFWDSSSKAQKAIFGNEFSMINYVECGVTGDYRAQQQACKDAGIQAYPTWAINGEKYMGVQSQTQLSAIAGC